LNNNDLRKKYIDKGHQIIKNFNYENQIREILEYHE